MEAIMGLFVAADASQLKEVSRRAEIDAMELCVQKAS